MERARFLLLGSWLNPAAGNLDHQSPSGIWIDEYRFRNFGGCLYQHAGSVWMTGPGGVAKARGDSTEQGSAAPLPRSTTVLESTAFSRALSHATDEMSLAFPHLRWERPSVHNVTCHTLKA